MQGVLCYLLSLTISNKMVLYQQNVYFAIGKSLFRQKVVIPLFYSGSESDRGENQPVANILLS